MLLNRQEELTNLDQLRVKMFSLVNKVGYLKVCQEYRDAALTAVDLGLLLHVPGDIPEIVLAPRTSWVRDKFRCTDCCGDIDPVTDTCDCDNPEFFADYEFSEK